MQNNLCTLNMTSVPRPAICLSGCGLLVSFGTAASAANPCLLHSCDLPFSPQHQHPWRDIAISVNRALVLTLNTSSIYSTASTLQLLPSSPVHSWPACPLPIESKENCVTSHRDSFNQPSPIFSLSFSLSFLNPPTPIFPRSQDWDRQTLICIYF